MKQKKHSMLFLKAALIMVTVISFSSPVFSENEKTDTAVDLKLTKPLYKPFIERYILDEIKQLRVDNMTLRVELAEKITSAQLSSADRAIDYTASTVNNIFFIITATASIFVIIGWTSLRDIKGKTEEVVNNRVSVITLEYEGRLKTLEDKLKKRTEEIIDNQEEITKTNLVHSLWNRAGLEAVPQAKIDIYDEILKINPEDVEAIIYKADMVIELGEIEWALTLCNQAIEIDDENGYAFWQRACAHAELNNIPTAMIDITAALEKNPNLSSELAKEPFFKKMNTNESFNDMVSEYEMQNIEADTKNRPS